MGLLILDSYVHASRRRPDGVLEETDWDDEGAESIDFVSARTSTLTEFLSPAFDSSSTASVWVAEKRPVLRSFGNRDITEVICFWNPISSSLSASSKINICTNSNMVLKMFPQNLNMPLACSFS